MTASDIITDALEEIGVHAPGEPLSAEDAATGLRKLNRLFDNWNADRIFLYSTDLKEFQITAGHNPHTIGITANSPDWTVTIARPVGIEKDQANLILTDVTPNIYRPLQVVDDAWWMNNPVPALATQIPYYLYYGAGWPNGQVYLWPVPTTAYKVRLLLTTQLAALALADSFSLPQGYEDAIVLTLAESLSPTYERPISPVLAVKAAEARARIKSLNSEAPTMACDGAVQSMDSRPKASIANFMSGFFN